MRGRRRRLAALAAVSCLGLVGVACGGDEEPEPTVTNALGIPDARSEDDDAYEPREPSVGDGNSQTAAEIDGDLASAARTAGCTTAGFKADLAPDTLRGGTGETSARDHVDGDPVFSQSLPPTSGPHSGIWADWGFYDLPVASKHLVHNMEHGGVIVHYGNELSKADIVALGGVWSKRPAYTVFVPDESPKFPPNGVVVTSWQRWMVCKPFAPEKHTAVIERFITTYRGKGPEEVASKSQGSAPGLPKPIVFDPKTN